MMATSDGQIHALKVGDRTHRIVAELLTRGIPLVHSLRTAAIVRCASEVFKAYPVTYRPRESYFEAVSAAGVYLNRFRPLAPWSVFAIEKQVGTRRLDVAYRSLGTGYLIDEIKLGVGRYGEDAVQQQISAYLEAGTELWGAEFIGVRLCAIHEPSQTRLYLPGSSSPSPIAESAFAKELNVR